MKGQIRIFDNDKYNRDMEVRQTYLMQKDIQRYKVKE